MKNWSRILLLGAWMLGSILAGHAEKSVSKDEALKAIEVFEKDPSSTEGFTAASTIMAFAKTSDAVKLSLSKAVVPWLKGKDAPDADTRGMLLTAYIAGNVRSQLANGKAADDVYAGWQQVIATYDQLHQINSTVKVTEIDDLKAKEKAGTLRAYAAEVVKK